MESLLVTGVQEFHMEMRLLIHGEFDGIRSPEVSYRRCIYSSMETGELTGIRSPEVHTEDTLTHPWRVNWYQESRSFIWKMRLLIQESLQVQKFHLKKDVFTHPWRVYWCQKSGSFTRKIHLLIHENFTNIKSLKVPYGRCVHSSLECYCLVLPGSHELLPLGRGGCGYLSLLSLFTGYEVMQESLNYFGKECLFTLGSLLEVLTF